MKKRNIKFLLLIILTLIMIWILNNNAYAAEKTKIEIAVGEEKSFTFSDLTVNGVVPTKIKSGSSNNECISVEEIKTGIGLLKAISEIKIKGISEGESILTIYYIYTTSTIDAYGQFINQETVGSKEFNIKIGYGSLPSKEASAAEIYNYFDTYLENNKGIVENVLLEMDDPMCGILKQWKKTVEESIEEQKEIVQELEENVKELKKKDDLTAQQKELIKEQEERIVGIEDSIKLHEELKKFIVEAIYKKEGTGSSNVVGDEDAFNDGDDALDDYVYSHFANAEGENRNTVQFEDVLTSMENYIPGEEEPPEKFISKASTIVSLITNIGMVVSVLMVAVIGLKYMLGSIEEKAEYKKDMIPYLVGAGLLFGITAIVKVLQQWGETINNI